MEPCRPLGWTREVQHRTRLNVLSENRIAKTFEACTPIQVCCKSKRMCWSRMCLVKFQKEMNVSFCFQFCNNSEQKLKTRNGGISAFVVMVHDESHGEMLRESCHWAPFTIRSTVTF